MTKQVVCEACGAAFIAKYQRRGRVYCPKCRIRHRGPSRKQKPVKAENQALVTTALEARAAHMTYGQYVAAQQK